MWTANRRFVIFENETYDGITYKDTKSELLFGTYFFLSDKKIDH